MKPRCCHYCGQALPEHRLGVCLTPTQGRIFDIVVRRGGELDGEALSSRLGITRNCLKVHIRDLNIRLSVTGYRIGGRIAYRLFKSDERYHAGDALSEAQQKSLGL
jgi:predicted transcriptional regulator